MKCPKCAGQMEGFGPWWRCQCGHFTNLVAEIKAEIKAEMPRPRIIFTRDNFVGRPCWAARQLDRARWHTGALLTLTPKFEGLKVEVQSFVPGGLIDSGWNEETVYVTGVSAETPMSIIRRAIRLHYGSTEVTKLEIVGTKPFKGEVPLMAVLVTRNGEWVDR